MKVPPHLAGAASVPTALFLGRTLPACCPAYRRECAKLVSIVIGTLTAQIADCVDDTGRVGSCGAGNQVGFALGAAGFYAAIGTAIDALIQGRTTLYEAPAASSARQDRFEGRPSSAISALSATFSW